MGLLLKEGIDINLIKSAFLAFSVIGFLVNLINIIPIFKKRIPNYTLMLAGLIGNTSFLGIPNPIVKLIVLEGRRAIAIGIPRNDVLPTRPPSCKV